MGPVNWLAVVLAALAGIAVRVAWHGGLARGGWFRRGESWPGVAFVMLLATVMLGHNYARLGAAVLAAKPWLYWMQSGGLAIAFVMPAVWLDGRRHGTPAQLSARDCGGWLVVYLVMGTVFWVLKG